MHLGPEGDERWRHIRGVYNVTGATLQNGVVIAVIPINSPARTAAFLQADNIPVAEIPAARALAEIAGQRTRVT